MCIRCFKNKVSDRSFLVKIFETMCSPNLLFVDGRIQMSRLPRSCRIVDLKDASSELIQWSSEGPLCSLYADFKRVCFKCQLLQTSLKRLPEVTWLGWKCGAHLACFVTNYCERLTKCILTYMLGGINSFWLPHHGDNWDLKSWIIHSVAQCPCRLKLRDIIYDWSLCGPSPGVQRMDF